MKTDSALKYILVGFMLLLCETGCLLVTPGMLMPSPKPSDDGVPLSSKYQKAAWKAIDNEQYDVAEDYMNKFCAEAHKERNLPLDKPIPGCIAYWSIYAAQGKYDLAAEAVMRSSEALTEVHKNYPNDPGFSNGIAFGHYLHLCDSYLTKGDYDRALKTIGDALDLYCYGSIKNEGISSHLDEKLSKFEAIRSYLGDYYLETGEYEKARKYHKEHLNVLTKYHSIEQNIANTNNSLGKIYYAEGNYEQAEICFGGAAKQNANAVVLFPANLGGNVLMLGKIAEHKGDYALALKRYQYVIDMLEQSKQKDYEGARRVEQSDVWNEIGRCQLKAGKPDEAIAAYSQAMALRRATVTQTHPNYADALRGMAGAALLKGDTTSATLQAEESLKILDASLVPTHPRILPNLIALSSIYELTGKSTQAAPLNARIETILQKPLGPWKEDFMETAAFYSDILKKHGETAAAKQLDDLQSRQKPKYTG